jgi:hypothetical protein
MGYPVTAAVLPSPWKKGQLERFLSASICEALSIFCLVRAAMVCCLFPKYFLNAHQ